MKRFILCLLVSLLGLSPVQGLGSGDTDADLRNALSVVDNRDVYLECIQTLPETNEKCAFFVTANMLENPAESTDFAFWFVAEGENPQLLLEGRDQRLPSENDGDTRLRPREYLQGFEHRGHTYFIASLRTGERQSDHSYLYMVQDGQLVLLTTLYAGAGYHPDVGLYQLSYDFATDPGIEAMRALTPEFLLLDGAKITHTQAIPAKISALKQLANGDEFDHRLKPEEMKTTIDPTIYYLPNNMFVINYRERDTQNGLDKLYSVYVGIENGRGMMVRYPDQLEAPDVDQPFWHVCYNADDVIYVYGPALVESGYYFEKENLAPDANALKAPALFTPLDEMVQFTASDKEFAWAVWQPILTDGDFEYILFKDGTAEIVGYSGNKKKLTLPGKLGGAPVTSIGSEAFHFWRDLPLQSLTIPKGITRIGVRAFEGSRLNEVRFPNTLTYIGAEAFSSCEKIKRVTLPKGLETIGEECFSFCENLVSVSIPASVTDIGNGAFAEVHEKFKATVVRNSYAEEYCKENDIRFSYSK